MLYSIFFFFSIKMGGAEQGNHLPGDGTEEGEPTQESLVEMLKALNNNMRQIQNRMGQMDNTVAELQKQMRPPPPISPETSTPFNPGRANLNDSHFTTLDETRDPDLREQTPVDLPIRPLGIDHPYPYLPPRHGNTHGTHPTPGLTLRPIDIPVLKLSDLHGLGTERTLSRFFKQVELCVPTDAARVQVALVRVDNGVASLITEEVEQKGGDISWGEFKAVCHQQFLYTVSVSQAWKEVEEEEYSMDEAPGAFVNRMRVKMKDLNKKFPGDALPKPNNIIKKKLSRGLPPTAQRRLADFQDEQVPLWRFLEMAEEQRQLAVMRGEITPRRSVPVNATTIPRPQPSKDTGGASGGLEEVCDKIEKMVERFEKQMSRRKGFAPKYCAFCQAKGHNLSECPKDPPRGVCFDCHRPNCKRGAAECPGTAGGGEG